MSSTQQTAAPRDSLLKSTSIVGAMTFLSRLSGLARDMVISRGFGAGIETDAFFVAFKIPNMLRRFFSEGAFAQAFVPVMAEYRATRTRAEAKELIDRTAGSLALALLVVTALGVVAAPLLILVFAPGPGFSEDGRAVLATDMLRFTFPYIFFISLTALAGSVLNTYRRFAVPAFTPVLLNLVLIVFAIGVAPLLERPALALALGVFVAGAVQLAFQVPFMWKAKLLPIPKPGFAHPGVKRIRTLMAPILFGSSVAQINILIDMMIASFLVAGSYSWLYYSDRLVGFPLGVFGVALATAVLPSLSEQHARVSMETFSATIDWALRLVLLIGVPAAVGLMLLAQPLITTIYYGGEFTDRDTAMAAASLLAFGPGLVGFILVKVLAPGYFSRQDTRTPVRIAVQALVLNAVLNVAFVLVLLRTGWAPAHAGLAAATSISGIYNAARLWLGLRRDGVYRPAPGWRALFLPVAGACIVMTAIVIWAVDAIGDWYTLDAWTRAGALVGIVIGGAVAYFAAGWLFGLRPRQFRGPAPVEQG